jgi:hypothetical protein
VETKRLRNEGWYLDQRRNASEAVHERRHRSRLPANLDHQALQFNTPQGVLLRGPSTGSPQAIPNLGAWPMAGLTDQPQLEPNPRPEPPPHHVLTPPGHFSNPVDNLFVATTTLAALPITGNMPVEIEARNAIEKLKTTMVQQANYSYSRERLHSTPVPSRTRSRSRHTESPGASSTRRRREPPRGLPYTGALDAQDALTSAQAHQAAETAQQAAQAVAQAASQPN